MRVDLLKKKIELYLKNEQLIQSSEYTKLEKLYLIKSRKNLTVANLLLKVSDTDEIKKILKLSSDFETYDWAIIVAYYSMYVSSLAALAKLGLKSKSHAATIAILEYNYVYLQKGLEIKHIINLTKAQALTEGLITKLMQTKSRRESAQYEATPIITREGALSSLSDAEEFITKIEEILQ